MPLKGNEKASTQDEESEESFRAPPRRTCTPIGVGVSTLEAVTPPLSAVAAGKPCPAASSSEKTPTARPPGHAGSRSDKRSSWTNTSSTTSTSLSPDVVSVSIVLRVRHMLV
ncbi:unnamed protein product [Prorocentrum cordatum]|uniref:Uncharacterized protein n=1 Tax=Prorocentrum cordatum TaxID=2364126 RepID=A0ABN9U4C9_9DINO|nr:unnamed protein product [Polarella glacialis]